MPGHAATVVAQMQELVQMARNPHGQYLDSAAPHRKRLAFDLSQREDLLRAGVMFQSGQLVRVNLAGLQAEGVMFQSAVTDAVGHIVKQTSEQPPIYLVKLLFSFRGVTDVEVPADRIHANK